MKTSRLGLEGPEVSQFGIGAMSFAGIYGSATEDESFAILDAARSAGVSHIDTAAAYGDGRSEEIIGKWLAANPGARDETTIATKAAFRTLDGKRMLSNDPVWMEEMLDRSLDLLGVEAVDIFYAHRIEPGRNPEEVAGEMGRLVEKGKTKSIAFSEIAPSTLRRAASEFPIAAVQSEYSLQTRAPELGLVQACAEVGAALVAFCPVGRGLLTDTPPSVAKIDGSNFLKTNPRFIEPNFSTNLALTEPFRALAAEMGVPAAGLAIAWVVAQGDHVIPIPGTKSVSHLKELLAGMALDLSEDDLSKIEAVLPVGWCHGDRYNEAQWQGPERYS
ncbi:MAG: aldo/keto reductase [Boseongicola sp.]|nr:aldo/keto reductase [Boseongicola sp.]